MEPIVLYKGDKLDLENFNYLQVSGVVRLVLHTKGSNKLKSERSAGTLNDLETNEAANDNDDTHGD